LREVASSDRMGRRPQTPAPLGSGIAKSHGGNPALRWREPKLTGPARSARAARWLPDRTPSISLLRQTVATRCARRREHRGGDTTASRSLRASTPRRGANGDGGSERKAARNSRAWRSTIQCRGIGHSSTPSSTMSPTVEWPARRWTSSRNERGREKRRWPSSSPRVGADEARVDMRRVRGVTARSARAMTR